jgi:AcrR family transcriptional regulator
MVGIAHIGKWTPMAHKTISDEDLLEKALRLFRASGFEGVSVNDLATATGLEKASLYHRFPGGKEEIALAVLGRVSDWFEQNVFRLLRTQTSPRKRVHIVSDKLKEFYGDGTLSCVTDVLSLPNGSRHIAEKLRIAMQAWLKSFTEIAEESGMSAEEARSRAEEAVMKIQGSLVLSRVLGNAVPFQQVIKGLPDLLTKAYRRS